MTPKQAAQREVRKAAAWLSCCQVQLEVAKRRLNEDIRAMNPHAAAQRREVEALSNVCHRAAEDLVGWRRLAKRQAG